MIEVNGIKYVPLEEGVQSPAGNRAVIVVDRGWIFAGDVKEAEDRIILTRPVWVFRWESVGFDGVIRDPKSKSVTLKPMSHPVEIPAGSEIFRVPVPDNWGL